MRTYSFTKKDRLLDNRSFKRVIRNGKRACDGLLAVHALENDKQRSRLGVSVGRACGGAVARNRLKRLIREAFRLSRDSLPPGFDYVVLVDSNWPKKIKGAETSAEAAKKLKLDRVKDSLVALADKAAGGEY